MTTVITTNNNNINAGTGTIYCSSLNCINISTPTYGIIIRSVLDNAYTKDFAISPTGDIYIPRSFSDISKYNYSSGQLVNESFLTSITYCYGLTFYNNKLYLKTASLINVYNNGNTFEASISPGFEPYSLYVYNNVIYIGQSTIKAYNVSDRSSKSGFSAPSPITTGSVIFSLCVENNTIYAADNPNGRITTLNATTGAIINSFFITGLTTPTGIDTYGFKLYVVSSGNILVYNFSSANGTTVNYEGVIYSGGDAKKVRVYNGILFISTFSNGVTNLKPFYNFVSGTYINLTNNPISTIGLNANGASFGVPSNSAFASFHVGRGNNMALPSAIFEGTADNAEAKRIFSNFPESNYSTGPIAWSSTILYFYTKTGGNYTRFAIGEGSSSFFTGQHGNYPLDQDLILNRIKYVGLLVSSADEGYLSLNRITREHITGSDAITITEALPKVKITDKDKDPAVWGVITNVANENVDTDGTMQTDDDTEWSNGRIGKDLIRINGLGEGALWVTNINGNICNGDWICSSIIPGYGRKQDDDLFHNYTAAKSTMSCNFDLNNDNLYQCKTIEHNGNTYIAAFIGVSYHCS